MKLNIKNIVTSLLVLPIGLFCLQTIKAQTQVFNKSEFVDSLIWDGAVRVSFDNGGNIYTTGRYVNYGSENFQDSMIVSHFDKNGQLTKYDLYAEAEPASDYGVDIVHHQGKNFISYNYNQGDGSVPNIIVHDLMIDEAAIFQVETENVYQTRRLEIFNGELHLITTLNNPPTAGGAYIIKTDLEGDLIWDYSFEESNAVSSTNLTKLIDGTYVLMAINYDLEEDVSNIMLIRFDQWGNEIWKEYYYGFADGNYSRVMVTKSGLDIYFAGTNDWKRCFTEVNFTNGEVIQEIILPNPDGIDNALVEGLFPLENGHWIAGGMYWDNFPQNGSAWVAELDEDFDIIWEQTYSCDPFEATKYIYDMEATPDGGYVLCGTIEYPAPQYNNIWLLKVDQYGNEWLPLEAFGGQLEYSLELGDSLVLPPITIGGDCNYTYEWVGNGSPFLNETDIENPQFVAENTGSYQLEFTVTDDSGESQTIIYTINVTYVGLEEMNKFNFNLYPNPTKNNIVIENKESGYLHLYNTIGSLVKSVQIASNATTFLDLSSLPKGIYYYHFIGEEKLNIRDKLVVQ